MPRLSLLLLALMFTTTVQADLFSDSATLTVTLNAPYAELRRTDDKELRFPATLLVGDSEIPAEVQVRGNFRLRTCSLPPLKLYFDKDVASGTLFDGQRELKLVRQCKNSDSYADYVRLEYLAYRLVAAAYPNHFGVRWLDLTYRDSGSGEKPRNQPGFVIERKKSVGKRLDMHGVDENSIKPASLDSTSAATVDLLQYMIGNTDYSVLMAPGEESCCHNTKLLAPEKDQLANLVPVLYDFDNSGLVNAPYAEPSAQLGLSSITTRKYRGLCRNNDAVKTVAASLAERQDELVAIVANDPLLSAKKKKKAVKYLNQFFVDITDPKRFSRKIIGECRG